MARRSKIEIAESLVKFFEEQDKAFYKSKLVEADLGMNSKTAEEWLELYRIINGGPRIRKIETDKTVLYEVVQDQ